MGDESQETWAALRAAVVDVPAMLQSALTAESNPRQAVIRVARIARHLYADAAVELGDREAEDLAGATLRLVRDRLVDIFGPAAWKEACSDDPQG
jgi:hypothetical protein